MTSPSTLRAVRHALAAITLVAATGAIAATDAFHGIEQALTTAQADKRGITLYVAGQAIVGAVTRVEPGQWVELHNQQWGRIVVRLDRIDGIATP